MTYADPQARNLIYNKVMDLASKIGRDDKSFHALEKRINDELDGLMHDFRRDFGDRLTETKYRLAWSVAVFLEKGVREVRHDPFKTFKADYVETLFETHDMRKASSAAFGSKERLQLFVSEWLRFWKER